MQFNVHMLQRHSDKTMCANLNYSTRACRKKLIRRIKLLPCRMFIKSSFDTKTECLMANSQVHRSLSTLRIKKVNVKKFL